MNVMEEMFEIRWMDGWMVRV